DGAIGATGGQGGQASGGQGGTGGIGNGAEGHGATGGAGGNGGNGGNIVVDAGTFNMSNSMSGSLSNSAGIILSSQNSGFASLVQQSANVQANLNVGRQ
ncbi:MAG: hypothetical protein ACOZCP_10105, partial [Pseudomonadota bacterium]